MAAGGNPRSDGPGGDASGPVSMGDAAIRLDKWLFHARFAKSPRRGGQAGFRHRRADQRRPRRQIRPVGAPRRRADLRARAPCAGRADPRPRNPPRPRARSPHALRRSRPAARAGRTRPAPGPRRRAPRPPRPRRRPPHRGGAPGARPASGPRRRLRRLSRPAPLGFRPPARLPRGSLRGPRPPRPYCRGAVSCTSGFPPLERPRYAAPSLAPGEPRR